MHADLAATSSHSSRMKNAIVIATLWLVGLLFTFAWGRPFERLPVVEFD
jgi:hypothetical protein